MKEEIRTITMKYFSTYIKYYCHMAQLDKDTEDTP